MSGVDFTAGAVLVSEDDTFFLDANVVVAWMHGGSPYHKAVRFFLLYLLEHGVTFCVSETVVHEVIHALSKILYAEDKLKSDPNNATLSESQRKALVSKYENQFIPFTKTYSGMRAVKVDKAVKTLQKFSEEAKERFRPFYETYCVLIPSSVEMVGTALAYGHDIPLHSSDAMIAAAATHSGIDTMRGLITLDYDVRRVASVLPVFYTDVRNADYQEAAMINMYDIQGLVDELARVTENAFV